MPRVKLDATTCLTAFCEPGARKTTYWDTIITGFVLDVRPNGSRTYSLRYVDEAGRQRQHKIGRYEDISFDQARKLAKRLRSEVTLGGNPAVQKEEKKAIPLYSELAQMHLDHVKPTHRSYATIEMYMRRHLVPRWGKLRLDEIMPHDISKWLAGKSETGLAPATVEKMRVTLNRSFELACRWQIPGGDRNPLKSVPRRRIHNARERYLTADQAQRLLKSCDESVNPQLGNIVRLLLLTGSRRGELLNAKWQHVDLERRAWHIPTSKTGKPRYVPLSQAAMDVIAALPRWDNCEWLLPNPETLKPYYDLKRPWDTARDAAGLEGLRIHDLRHSSASFMINAGIDLFAVGRILGHADHQSTMRYSHLANDTLMAAVEAGAAKMQAGWAGQIPT
jgi:integrase